MRPDIVNYIVELIADNKAITDNELLNKVKRRYPEFTESMLNSVLLKLEVAGVVSVSWVSKDVRRIEYLTSEEQ